MPGRFSWPWFLEKLSAGRGLDAGATSFPIAGGLDGVRRGHLHGWVFDRSRPSLRLAVEAVCPSGTRVAAVADRYRADVHKAGHGDGYSGFAIALARLSEPAGIRVFCRDPRVEVRSPAASRAHRKPVIFRQQSYVLHLDGRSPGAPVTGWAVDWSCPDRRRPLQLRADGKVLTARHATLFRGDIADRRSDGFHGFSFPFPAAHDVAIGDLANGASVRVSP